jgi:predicted MarR family transcription regulator
MAATKKPVVLSPHLLSPGNEGLSEFEFGMIVCWNAFNEWLERGTRAAGRGDLTFMDVVVLHQVAHRTHNRKLADICFVLNLSDTHSVNYSLKKLLTAKLVMGQKVGKEVLYRTTAEGETVIANYRDVRERCLLDVIEDDMRPMMSEFARFFTRMSGLYDQAARAASSL